MQWYGYDVQTWQLLWGPTDRYESDWGYYNGYTGRIGAYGRIYTAGYDGTVRSYDIKTGELMWDYYAGNAGFETPYGTWPFYGGLTIADGKVFAATGEHSPGTPLWKGEKLHVMDALTGEALWNISGWYQANSIAAADGKLIALNGYDNQIYCFSKGPSATTVSAPQTVIPKDTGILLTGTVTDQSSGAKQLIEDGKFSIVPAISDASMSTWMEYLYMQKPKPENATGVTVKLTAYDPNGNSQDIGSTTTDTNGKYALTWTPTLEGMYYVVASFGGSNSYGGSQDTAYFAVGPAAAAPAPTATPTPTPTLAPTATPVPTASPSPAPTPPGTGLGTEYYIAIAAVVIIGAVAAVAVILRRRK
jgi:hypothetical protein